MQISATDRALSWAALRDGAIVVAGVTVPGDTTASAELVSAESEPALLGALVSSEVAALPLPDAGEWVEAGTIYGYGGSLVIVRQSHTRTEHAPEDVPALISVYRADASEALEWVANEQVQIGTRRLYGGVLYECLQAHMTLSTWTPEVTPALWRVVESEPETGEWVSGEQGVQPGDLRTYEGVTYRALQSPGINIWPPPTVPAIWEAV